MYAQANDNDEFYDRFERRDVPSDLKQYYRHFKPGFWGFVCPNCKYVFPPLFGGMPESFRKHLEPWQSGEGCAFKPGKTKKKRDDDDF